MQEQIAARDYIIDPKDERQDVIDDHQHDSDQWQKTFAVCEVV
jgi:hypothetical protein